MALDSTARAHWEGDLFSGSGTATLDTGAAGPFEVNWKARAEEHGGVTSPEELIAAAHATCYSMALSNTLAKAGHPPASLDVEATATFVPGTGITGILLTVQASVPGLTAEEFATFALGAKTGCPVSAALTGTTITLDATLV